MRFKKILFVVPKVQASYAAKLNPHLGVAYLTAVLEKNEVEVSIFDFALDYEFEDLVKKVKEFKPELIGVTLFSFDFVNSYELINRIRETFGLPVVLGGVHVSSIKEKVLEHTKADYALYGESENSFIELCSDKKIGEICGLIYRSKEDIFRNPFAPLIKDLDTIPFPAYEKFELKKYTYPQEGRLQIATSRGCPYGCVYCAVKLSMGLGFRPRSPENVIQEIEYWSGKGYTFFEFVDDCFTLDIERAKKICQMIINNNLGIKWNCANGIRADRVDEELLNLMKRAGCEFVSYGLETGSKRVLNGIKKGLDWDKAMETFELTRRVGLKFAVNFIIGLPGEKYEDALESIYIAKKIPANYVNFSNMVPYPGTETYDYIKREGKFLLPEETYLTESTTKLGNPVFETPEFSYSERVMALEKGRGIAKRTHLQHRFGKKLGWAIYPIAKSDFVYNAFRRMISGNPLIKKVYDKIRK